MSQAVESTGKRPFAGVFSGGFLPGGALGGSAGRPDWWLLAITAVLLAIGLMLVFSASGIYAERMQADTYYFFKRQTLFALIGCIALAVAAALPRNILYALHYPALFACLFMLVICLSPLGTAAKGAHRWIGLGPVRIQPMEFAKIALVLYLAYFLSTKQEIIKTFSKGVIPPFLITGVMCLLLLLQPDFGGAVLIAVLLFFMCFVGGTRIIYLAASALIACGCAYELIKAEPYRLRRYLAFRDPFAVANDEGYHLVQSFLAFGSGGLSGTGLGASKQKLFYLPEAHNDFIMAVFGEEAGFIGISLIFILLAAFFWRGMRIALRQTELRSRLLAFGLLLTLALSCVLNLAVVMGVVPPKGVPMPFISYGGSSLLASMICVGLLLNLSRKARD
ncbi:putative lipid II flippase FtsW [Desulfovibrio sp. OttesenSCG-928-A18]|nr:putative lipid II flippase FtsW [Desulfovibrio sp. OttesenSCG-928-A18]